jgi:hypothetical protein
VKCDYGTVECESGAVECDKGIVLCDFGTWDVIMGQSNLNGGRVK